MMASKKNDIVDAAKKLLWQVGYESMSPRLVLKASGAGQGSMYHHFETKADLAEHALEEIAHELTEEFDSIFAAHSDPLDKVTKFLTIKRDGVNGCRLGRLANERQVLCSPLRVPIARYFEHVEQQIKLALKEAQSQGRLGDTLDASNTAKTIVAVIQGGFVLSRISQNAADLRNAARGALALLNHAASKDLPA